MILESFAEADVALSSLKNIVHTAHKNTTVKRGTAPLSVSQRNGFTSSHSSGDHNPLEKSLEMENSHQITVTCVKGYGNHRSRKINNYVYIRRGMW